jgi:hypothetical protein
MWSAVILFAVLCGVVWLSQYVLCQCTVAQFMWCVNRVNTLQCCAGTVLLEYALLKYALVFSCTAHLRYANALSGTADFFDNQEALFSALSSLRLAHYCARLGGAGDEEQQLWEAEIGAVYRTAEEQLYSLINYIVEREQPSKPEIQSRMM